MRVRLRVLAGFVSSIVLAIYLGFADISLPHDKFIHFGLFFVISLLFYWILDSKAISAWRNVAFIVCTLVGGIGSEYLQHFISPFRTFDPYDILANVLGSSAAILLSSVYQTQQLKKRRRHKITRRISDLEAQLEPDEFYLTIDDDDDDIPMVPLRDQQPEGSEFPSRETSATEIQK
ncbi:DEKNAAC105617 [Brettanomyces naardenensis]|uniref:DEKNAAC105618 n=1 Tax=Brettanomyces naardenensis TaxID=13370 RepID=A0A448YTU4_BRENA|nr:DEKNAAC105617 [Brettanomyces naardenensis]